MRFLEEVVVEEFLPTFRTLLAGELRERGRTQSEVADLLGISQSAVSKYAHGEVEINDEIAGDDRVRELVGRLAEGLATGDVSRVQALVETEVLIRRLERGDLLARLHESAYPPIAEYDGPLDIHDPEGEFRMTERVRSSVRRGVRALENTSGFAALIPAVGSNLVEALPDATTIDGVAGVPGRILDIKGRATVPGEPEFGVSEHAASLLLAARDAGSGARAALNVRYDPETIEALEAAGYTVAEFDADAELEAAVADAVAGTPDADVLYQTGGFGIEPICYLLGEDASAVVEIVRRIA
jgi:predicted fused transcriptional regulator/phosphomethylpyrimidine kinase/predicted transcriptional regulator